MVADHNSKKFDLKCKRCGCSFAIVRVRDNSGNVIGGEHPLSMPNYCKTCKQEEKRDRWAYRNNKRRARRDEAVYTCAWCGIAFKGRAAKYCESCRSEQAYYKSKNLTCIVCGKTFSGFNGSKCCTQECRNTHQREVAKKKSQERYDEALSRGLPKKANPGAHVDGVICEHYFDVYAYKSGWRVAMPTMDAMAGVDRVVQIEGKWLGVQIKKINKARQIVLWSDKNKLLPDAVDLIAAVDMNDGTVFLYNWNDYRGRKVITTPIRE